MEYIRKIRGKWCVVRGGKSRVLPADIAERFEAGTFRFGDPVPEMKSLVKRKKS